MTNFILSVLVVLNCCIPRLFADVVVGLVDFVALVVLVVVGLVLCDLTVVFVGGAGGLGIVGKIMRLFLVVVAKVNNVFCCLSKL